jgi:hypothetical protein
MKKIVVILLLVAPFFCQAQYSNDKESSIPLGSNSVTAGDYLIQSGKMQYASMFLAASATAVYLIGSNKVLSDYGSSTNLYKAKMRNVHVATGMLGAVSFFCTVASINYKITAGKKLNETATLNAYVNPGGVTLALKF